MVLKMKFFANYLLCTQGDSEGRKFRDQAVNGANLDRRELWGAVLSFFRLDYKNSLHFVFRMNMATCSGRIWDSQADPFCSGAQSTVFDIFSASAERE
jgi:hypothetical protein